MPDRNLVLVVDDDPGMLKGIQRLLLQHGFRPVVFSSAAAFKNHAEIHKAVCVILDINLNDGSGIELRYHLKANGTLCRSSTSLGTTILAFGWLHFNPIVLPMSPSRSRRSR